MEVFKSKNSKSKKYLFTVSSTELYNVKAIKTIHDIFNALGTKVKIRGRHSYRKQLFSMINKVYEPGRQNDVPIKYADSLAIYLR